MVIQSYFLIPKETINEWLNLSVHSNKPIFFFT